MNEMTNSLPKTEWSLPFKAIKIDAPRTMSIEANSDARTALAKRFDIEAIGELSAEVTIRNEKRKGRVTVTGNFEALITQICARTGKVFSAPLSGDVEGYFTDKTGTVSFVEAKKRRDEEFGEQPNFIDEADDPESMIDGYIDLGELVSQCFGIALDPYATAPDAPPAKEIDESSDVKVENPFAVLGQLREFMNKD